MFANTYQSGFLSILYSIGSKPLQIWDKSSSSFFIQSTTATSSVSPIRTFSHQSWKSWGPMWLPLTSHALRTRNKHLELSCPSSSWSLRTYIFIEFSWKNTSHLKCKSSMTKTSEEDSELQTINQQPEWNRSFVPCQWDWMRDGTKFSLTCQILPEELTVVTTLRLWGWRFMQTVE